MSRIACLNVCGADPSDLANREAMLTVLRSEGRKFFDFIAALVGHAALVRDAGYLHKLVQAFSAILEGALEIDVQVAAIQAVHALAMSDSAILDEADNRVLAELFISLLRNYGNCLALCMEV